MTTRKHPSPPPTGLSPEALSLWRRCIVEYVFESAADMALLAELARTVDRLREVQAAIKAGGLVVVGASGQPRANPLLQVEDTLRRTILAHIRALRLTSLEL